MGYSGANAEKVVKRGVNELVALGLITVNPGSGRKSTRYDVVWGAKSVT